MVINSMGIRLFEKKKKKIKRTSTARPHVAPHLIIEDYNDKRDLLQNHSLEASTSTYINLTKEFMFER